MFEAIIWLRDLPPDLATAAHIIGGAALRLDRKRYSRVRNHARYWLDPAHRASRLTYAREHAAETAHYRAGWYQRNRERVLAAATAWRDEHRDEIRRRDHDWRHSPEGREARRMQKRRAWERMTPEQRAAYNARQRAYRRQGRPQAADRERQRSKIRRAVYDLALSVMVEAQAAGLPSEVAASRMAEVFDLRRGPKRILATMVAQDA